MPGNIVGMTIEGQSIDEDGDRLLWVNVTRELANNKEGIRRFAEVQARGQLVTHA